MFEVVSGGLASFIFVALKAFQQRNIAFDNYIAVMPTSILMTLTEVYVIALILKVGYDLPVVLSIGLGAGTGAMLAMALHRKIFGRREEA